MRHYYDRSGGLTLPRELHFDDATRQLLTNPVHELAALWNGTIAAEVGIKLTPGVLHTIKGTDGGSATSVDIEVEFALPASGGACTFSLVVLANKGYVVGGGDTVSNGVTVALTVSSKKRPDGSRPGAAKISAVGAAPCIAASPYCQNATTPENGRVVTAPFTVLAGETTLALRVLVDRVIVEAFVQHGRVALTKSYIPRRWQDSAVHLLATSGDGIFGGGEEPTATKADIWSMGCGWVDEGGEGELAYMDST
jgi:hypothetical protein